MKTVILILIFFCVGLLSGKYFFSTNEVVVRSETIPIESGADKKLDSMSDAFFNLTQEEFLEYTKLKDQKEKYLKADEIIGKIILIFLANVQMRMNPEVKSYFVDGNKPKIEQQEDNVKDGITVLDLPKPQLDEESDFRLIKKEVKEGQFQEAANKVPFEIKSPYAFFKKAKPIDDLAKMRRFNGSFRGKLLIENGNKADQVHDVELNINFIQDGSKVTGDYESKLSYQGGLYSHNRGSGDNGKIKSGKKGLFLLEMSPSSFMHLKYMEGEDYFLGKYYDNDEYRGLVRIYPTT